MATIAILHVFISHFAIGGGLYLVVAERSARRGQDAARLAFLERLSRVFVLVTVVGGALTGVGIWFIIGLLNPAATSLLIHNFVWGWAIEWTFFVVEIAAAILYYYGWRRLAAGAHLAIGWIYFVAAWLSLVVINGIITFMLTPGRWLATGGFWDGFFNPTYWPSLVMRTGVCLMLAGVYTLAVASAMDPSRDKARIVRYNARWALGGLLVTLPGFYWYWKAIPAALTGPAAMAALPAVQGYLDRSYGFAAALLVLMLLFGFAFPRRFHEGVAILSMGAALGWFGSFELVRETVRKPYVVTGAMYANGVEPAREAEYRKDGYLAAIPFRTGNDGRDLLDHACLSCHTLRGYRSIAEAFDGTDPAFISGVVKGIQVVRASMPPFMGTDAERDLLGKEIASRVDTRPLSTIYGLKGAALGRKVYQVRCAICHQPGGAHDNSSSVTGLSAEDAGSLLESLPEMSDQMPPFTGSREDREALIRYLATLKPAAGGAGAGGAK